MKKRDLAACFLSLRRGFFIGGDQGLLNAFFKGWRDKPPAFRLPFIYNMTSGAIYTYAAAFKKYGAQVVQAILTVK